MLVQPKLFKIKFLKVEITHPDNAFGKRIIFCWYTSQSVRSNMALIRVKAWGGFDTEVINTQQKVAAKQDEENSMAEPKRRSR